MERFGNIVSMFDYLLNTKRKRHLAGGMLISASLLFGSLAFTVMTMKSEDDYV